MYGIRHISVFLGLLVFNLSVIADEKKHLVDHDDPIEINKTLTLSGLVDLTLQNYPEQRLNQALIEEVDALEKRSKDWLSGAYNVSLRYEQDFITGNTGFHEIETEVEFPLWNWGQKEIAKAIAEQAEASIGKQKIALRLHVSGLVRRALWDMSLEKIRFEQAKMVLKASKVLLKKVETGVELGDLARVDFVLAQTNHLEKKSRYMNAEAEMLHARERYYALTQTIQVPEDYTEAQSELDNLDNHPALRAINALIEREKVNVTWVESEGAGQPIVTVGGRTEKGGHDDDYINALGIGISIPFGGKAHLAPKIAEANIELTKMIVQREHLHRKLEADFHEINHQLAINQANVKMAMELKEIAEKQLEMIQFGFDEGEINLLDLLKVQTKTHLALRQLKEHEIMLQRNIALYNQMVGEQP